MSNYINPVRQIRRVQCVRGGPMDTAKLEFICQQCSQSIALSLRQAHRGVKPTCPKCGPGAAIKSRL